MWPFEYKYNVQSFWLKRILNIIIQAGILESTKISASEDLNALENSPAQFMALQILSRKGEVLLACFLTDTQISNS